MNRRESNQILLGFLLIYALITVPLFQAVFIVVFGLIAASIFKDQQDLPLRMFGFIARIITKAKDKSGNQSTPIRDQVIKVCCAIDKYPKYASSVLYRKRQLFFMLNKTQQQAASTSYKRILENQRLHEVNYEFLSKIKLYAMKEFKISEIEIKSLIDNSSSSASGHDAVELLEHFVRDWSADVEHEKSRGELLHPFGPWLKNRKRILVPGSGLGRLAADIVSSSSENGREVLVDAPEMSASMWLGSKYATSHTDEKELSAKIYPYLLQFSYWQNGSDQLESVPLRFPVQKNHPNFVCTDFLTFDNGYKYEAIATLYFIDTAQNVFSYIDRIAEMLAPGGIWCNYGPIKWGTASFVEFSVDELLTYLESSGWSILEFWDQKSNRYNGSEKSLLNSRYNLVGWVAKRK